MKWHFLLLILIFPIVGKGQYQPWKMVEPGIHQFRGLFPPLRNTFLIEVDQDGYYLINTPFNSADQAALINSIRTDFPKRKLKALFVLENDYASASGAFLLTSTLGKVPIYATHSLTFTEEDKYQYLSKNPKNQEAGKITNNPNIPTSMVFLHGELAFKKIGEKTGNQSFIILAKPSGSLFCPTNWIENPFPLSNSWNLTSMIQGFIELEKLNPSRIFGGNSAVAFTKFQAWEIQRNWELWMADYQYRKREKMNYPEFIKSMNQRKTLFPWVPNDEKSLEILWKVGLKSL